MQELTDDQLDGLFRKSAEEFEPPYDPAAWEAMKDQLDDRDRAAFWKKWLPWGLPLLLLLLMSGVWYTYRQVRPDVGNSAKPVITTKKSETGQQRVQSPVALHSGQSKAEPTEPIALDRSEASVEKSKGFSAESGQIQSQLVSKKQKYSDDRSRNGSDNVHLQAGRTSVIITRNTATKDRLTAYEERVNERTSNYERRNTRNKLLAIRRTGSSLSSRNLQTLQEPTLDRPSDDLVADRQVRSVNTRSLSAVDNLGQLPEVATLTIQPAKWNKLIGLENRDVTPPERSEPMSMPVSIPVLQRGFSVRLAVAPDLSAVGLQNFTRPGTNLGALLEYRLASRWSVQTGVIWSMKRYKAGGDQYDADLDYWTKFPKKPEEISGQCSMIDIPINVRYDIAVQPRLDKQLQPSRWFVSGGVTSYVTLKEDYSYTYSAHSYGVKQWTAPSGGYGFSQLNLSMGYERALGRRLSWQVEPFLKAPLKGVGFFKIDLLSTGAFLSIRYKL